MKRTSPRGPIVALVTGLFLVFSFNSIPSVPSVPANVPPPPDPKEIAMLEDLASWVLGSDGHGFQPVESEDLSLAIRERSRSFDLFRRYTDKAARRRFLKGLPYGDDIFLTAQRFRLDSLLLAAMVQVESQFSSRVVSPRGAVGLMQVLPATAQMYGAGDLTDPKVNLEVGSRYFSGLLKQYGGDVQLALAAYNAGPVNVDRYGGVPPFRETQAYVDKVLTLYIDHHKKVWDASGATDLLAMR